MKSKIALSAAALLLSSFAAVPAVAVNPIETYTVCDASTCYVYECRETEGGTTYCSVSYSYPRQREVSPE